MLFIGGVIDLIYNSKQQIDVSDWFIRTDCPLLGSTQKHYIQSNSQAGSDPLSLQDQVWCVYFHRGGASVEMKPELQRVLESRKRDQVIKQRKQEDEARRKISPLEAELLKRHRKLEEVTDTHKYRFCKNPSHRTFKNNVCYSFQSVKCD